MFWDNLRKLVAKTKKVIKQWQLLKENTTSFLLFINRSCIDIQTTFQVDAVNRLEVHRLDQKVCICILRLRWVSSMARCRMEFFFYIPLKEMALGVATRGVSDKLACQRLCTPTMNCRTRSQHNKACIKILMTG